MDQLSLIRELSFKTDSKIILVVLDGLGGLPHPDTGKTELETANIPNLDALAAAGVCGLSDPVMPGITPGSGPGHLSLFGYDPIHYVIGRGVLEALGIDFDLEPGDVAARGNLCTLDEKGVVIDRRAGRIATEKSRRIAELLDGMEFDSTKVIVEVVKDHRLVTVFRGEDLYDDVTDSDPQRVGVVPQPVIATAPSAERMAAIANHFINKANDILAGHHPANGLLLRGFSQKPKIPSFNEVYKLKSCAIASYPMYRGLAKVVGMTVVETGPDLADEIETLKSNYHNFDFFFLHFKGTDAAGEDGDFKRKVAAIEEFDLHFSKVTALQPDVLIVTGDHSTPAALCSHSWHPVPVVLHSRYCRPDAVRQFNEASALGGGLGRFPACQLMPLAMANALKLEKYGA